MRIRRFQGLVKGALLCFRNPYFFQHGESSSTASQLTPPASQKSKDLNKVLLLYKTLSVPVYHISMLYDIYQQVNQESYS